MAATGADADEATTALIAAMLAEDNAYHDTGYDIGADDSADEDYGQGSKRKRAAKGSKGRAPAVGQKRERAPDEGAQGQVGQEKNTDTERPPEFSQTGRRKRKDSGAKQDRQSRGWSEEEERLYLEGLNLHGRDWKAVASHIGSRDSRAVASHAQKHFIRLCLEGQLLPAKVAESGAGYTLSGKLLDPTSSSARAYGLKPELLAKLQEEGSPSLVGLALGPSSQQDKENTAGNNPVQPAAPPAGDHITEAACAPGHSHEDGTTGTDHGGATDAPAAALTSIKARAPRKTQSAEVVHKDAAPAEAAALQQTEPTEYMRNRPRRELAGLRTSMGATTESLELIRPQDFMGPPGARTPMAQPFHVHVHPQVLLVVDLQAHLSEYEVIGLLGGRWDPEALRIRVQAAFPCERASGSDSVQGVELDPQAELAARDAMTAQGLIPVGWYHSHPSFAPLPSQKDNENQRNYQAFFRDEASKQEPFLGAILGPYDLQLPTERSAITWFLVRSRAGALVPYNVQCSPVDAGSGLCLEALDGQVDRVLQAMQGDQGRVDLAQVWRPFLRLEQAVLVAGILDCQEGVWLASSRKLHPCPYSQAF
ncbi:hypothetical protein WJX73_004742 [Symbiochloris irregularis]|uniref:Myb-like, SWIRM and MPN domain-containing protein 1 n=1 Tax=Symbiochloris irregularis TaxID=706552 RepID=A0AAW1P2B2_9CHLO